MSKKKQMMICPMAQSGECIYNGCRRYKEHKANKNYGACNLFGCVDVPAQDAKPWEVGSVVVLESHYADDVTKDLDVAGSFVCAKDAIKAMKSGAEDDYEYTDACDNGPDRAWSSGRYICEIKRIVKVVPVVSKSAKMTIEDV